MRNNCAKRHKDWKFPWYISDISNLAGSKLTRCRVCLSSLQYTPLRPWSNVLNILTEQHWTFVQQSWVLFSDVQLLGGQTCWTFCWTRLNFALTITHYARTNWTNVQWLVKRTEQHSPSRKTKEMLSRSTFVQWKVWSRSNFTEQCSTRVNKAQQGGQTLWTFCTQQMFSVVQWNVQYVWPIGLAVEMYRLKDYWTFSKRAPF